MTYRAAFALALCLLLTPVAVRADEIADAITEAEKAYTAKDYSSARNALGEALQLLAQRAATSLGAALPIALPGWTASEIETNTAQLAFLGGGVQATRHYENAQSMSVQIQATADSPLLGQLGMMLNNPAIAGAVGKLIRVGSQRAIQTSDNEIQMMVNNRILISVSGDAPMDAKLAYAKAIDFAKVAAAP